MSKRPTTISRKDYTNATGSAHTYSYAIIGDTVAATLYAKRLLGNNVTTTISLINEGVDRTNEADLIDTRFAAVNNKRILHHLLTERIHMVPAGDDEDEPDNLINTQTNQVIYYHIGAGPLGDFIAAYHIPRLGPWFTHSSNNRLDRFLSEFTQRSPLNDQEKVIHDTLQDMWNLHSTSSVIVKLPSILNCHLEYIRMFEDFETREIFLGEYNTVNQANTVDYITEIRNLEFTPGTSPGLYDITGSNNLSLSNVKPIWKTNPYTYLHLASLGGLDPNPIAIPTFYRAVLSIPLVAGNVDLSSLTPGPDLITTHLTFSLYDINNPHHSGLSWLMQFYTAAEDLSVIDPNGRYADTGRTLLIVEGLSTKNKRKASYNTGEHELQINYNNRIIEHGFLREFATIVAGIYLAYTGETLSVDSLIAESSICGVSGTCQDGHSIVDYAFRESPMLSIIQTGSNMYGLDIFPNIPKF